MKKWLLNAGHGANLIGLGAQILQVVPQKPWVMVFQAMLAALAPSMGGVGHSLVFGGKQDKD